MNDRTWYRGEATIEQDGTAIPVRCHYVGGTGDEDEVVWAGGFESPAADLDLDLGEALLVLPGGAIATILITRVESMDGRFRGIGPWPEWADDAAYSSNGVG